MSLQGDRLSLLLISYFSLLTSQKLIQDTMELRRVIQLRPVPRGVQPAVREIRRRVMQGGRRIGHRSDQGKPPPKVAAEGGAGIVLAERLECPDDDRLGSGRGVAQDSLPHVLVGARDGPIVLEQHLAKGWSAEPIQHPESLLGRELPPIRGRIDQEEGADRRRLRRRVVKRDDPATAVAYEHAASEVESLDNRAYVLRPAGKGVVTVRSLPGQPKPTPVESNRSVARPQMIECLGPLRLGAAVTVDEKHRRLAGSAFIHYQLALRAG